MNRINRALLLLALVTLAGGCREAPGEVDYSGLGPVFDRLRADAGAPKLGPKPYQTGAERLSLGIFYEGGYSERVPIDGASSNYYIFLADGKLSYTLSDETSDVVEGTKSDRITLAGTSWWGGGVVWTPSRDLSTWTTLAVSLKSSEIAAVTVTVGSTSKEVPLSASTYGYKADGAWHNLRIPLKDFADAGVTMSDIKVAFALGGTGGKLGEEILVDDLYLE